MADVEENGELCDDVEENGELCDDVEDVLPRENIEIGSGDAPFAALDCGTMRIGSFKFSPPERVICNSKGVRIVAPVVDDPTKKEVLHVQSREIVKILIHCGKAMPILFMYCLPTCCQYIREKLRMNDEKQGLYYDSCAKEETFKRITFLLSSLSDDVRATMFCLYGKPSCVLDELSARDANEILLKACPKDNRSGDASLVSLPNEIRQILIYPRGKGGISINTEDYGSLAQDQFLNDVIIDFYLKYLCAEILSEDVRNKTHVFSSFFYKRLTTKVERGHRMDNSDGRQHAAQKRHNRVKNWTKNVNIFEKDFIVIPINESSHWFLAIVCFPGMKGPHTVVGNKPVTYDDISNKKKGKATTNGLKRCAAATITPVSKTANSQWKGGAEERDEADGSDSDLDETDSESEMEELIQTLNKSDAIKQPCILIFDSLAGSMSRQRVVATLRDYLTCEYQSRTKTQEAFTKLTMRGSCPKVPQQTNFTDCGLYLLQYVEQFFKVPINDYRLPIKELTNWFEEIVVTRKREEISDLIKTLVAERNPDGLPLPDIPFPTLNGTASKRLKLSKGSKTN